MVELRSKRKPLDTTHAPAAPDAFDTIPAATDSSDEDNDNDEDGIPSNLTRPSSSRGSEFVSLKKPLLRADVVTGEHIARPATRNSMPGRLQQRLDSDGEQPQKRRKTLYDPQKYTGSSMRSEKSAVHHAVSSQGADDIVPSIFQEDGDESNDDNGEAAPPGLLGKVNAAFTKAKIVGQGSAKTQRTRSRMPMGRRHSPALDRMTEPLAMPKSAPGLAVVRNNDIDADVASVKEEEVEETLFVLQEHGYSPGAETDQNNPDDQPIQEQAGERDTKLHVLISEDKVRDASDKEAADVGSDYKRSADLGDVNFPHEAASLCPSSPESHLSDGSNSIALDGIDSEDESPATLTGDAAELFRQDIAKFTHRHQGQIDFPPTFEALPGDGHNTVRMRYEEFRQCVLLMKDDLWTGHGRMYWVNQPLSTLEPVTTPGRALFGLLARIERIYSMMPRAPRTKSQTDFLHQHEAMISHYLSQMRLICRHITRKRLRSSQNIETQKGKHVDRKQDEMLSETMTRLIPMLLRCANGTWALAGRDDHNAFMKCTIDIFEHVIICVQQLCEATVRGHKRSATKVSDILTQKATKVDPRKEQAKSLAFKLILVIQEIRRARDVLADEGIKQQLRQEKQAVLMDQMKKNHEAMRLQREKFAASCIARSTQKQPSTLAVTRKPAAGSHRQTHQDNNGPEPSTMPGLQDKSKSVASRIASKDPQVAAPKIANHKFRKWSREEQAFLLGKIQAAYTAVRGEPRLPDIDGYLCTELDRPPKDILHQTEILLALMLRRTGEIEDETERKAWVQRLMSSYPSMRAG